MHEVNHIKVRYQRLERCSYFLAVPWVSECIPRYPENAAEVALQSHSRGVLPQQTISRNPRPNRPLHNRVKTPDVVLGHDQSSAMIQHSQLRDSGDCYKFLT